MSFSPKPQYLSSISAYISKNKACTSNAILYLGFGICAQWLHFFLMNSWEMFDFNAIFPDSFTNWGANMRMTLNNTLGWDWLYCASYFIHSITTTAVTLLKNNGHNPAQTEARKCKPALQKWEVSIIVIQCIDFFPRVRSIWILE